MAWRWPHNIQEIHDRVLICFPGITIFGIGDAAHQDEHSDHNPDSGGVVHAADIMTLDYQTKHKISEANCATKILNWLLTTGVRNSLEYVIHNRKIYERSNNWAAKTYTGTDPHTNHIHVSGMHGSHGADAGTGNGYSTAAEAMSPAGMPCEGDEVELTDKITLVKAADVSYSSPTTTVAGILASTNYYVLQTRNQQATQFAQIMALLDPEKIATAIVAKLPSTGLTQEQVTAGVKEAIDGINVTLSADDEPGSSGE